MRQKDTFTLQTCPNVALPTRFLTDLDVPKGNPLSRRIEKEISQAQHGAIRATSEPYDLQTRLLTRKNGSTIEKSGRQKIRVPIYPHDGQKSVKTAVVEQPHDYGLRSDGPLLTVRPKKAPTWSFKRLGPGLTKSDSFIPSTVLGDAKFCLNPKKSRQRPLQSVELTDSLGRDMQKARKYLAQREGHELKRSFSVDRTENQLKNFDTKMKERKAIAVRLSKQVNRRVDDLVFNTVEGYRRKLEHSDLVEMNQGPRPKYDLFNPLIIPTDPNLVTKGLKTKPYEKLSFTAKPNLMKLYTSTSSFEKHHKRKIGTKEFLLTKHAGELTHRECQPGLTENEVLPQGMRNPDFHHLIVVGTNKEETSRNRRILPVHEMDDNSVSSTEYFTKLDFPLPLFETAGKNPSDPIHEPEAIPEKVVENQQINPILDICPTNPNVVNIFPKENALDIFVQLCCVPGQPPATTTLLLTNLGVEPLQFGLHPFKYPDLLWSEEKVGNIYFIEPTGVLEQGDSRMLTIVFECHQYGNFAESYKLWTLPTTTTPASITMVVHGRSGPRSNWEDVALEQPSVDGDLVAQIERFETSFSAHMEQYAKDALSGIVACAAHHPGQPSLEERFKQENNLEFQSEGVTKLKYVWVFAHLDYSTIPWYDNLIDQERDRKGEVPGEVTQRMLAELAEAQRCLKCPVQVLPDYVYRQTLSTAENVYWRNPSKLRCPVHDQEYPTSADTAKMFTKFEKPTSSLSAQAPNSTLRAPVDPALDTPAADKQVQLDRQSETGEDRNGKQQQPTAHPSTSRQNIQPSTSLTRQKPPSRSGVSEWVPMTLINDVPINGTKKSMDCASTKQKKPRFTKPPQSAPTDTAVAALTDHDKLTNEKLLHDEWIRHCADEDWIGTAVTFVMQRENTGDKNEAETPIKNLYKTSIMSSGSIEKIKVPQWDFSIRTLRHAIQQSDHHILIKIALLKEITDIERVMGHFVSSVPVNYTFDKRTDELFTSAMEIVIERSTKYAENLYSYFERRCASNKPTEPVQSPELIKARKKKSEEATSPEAKSGSTKNKKHKTADTAPEDPLSDKKSRSKSKESLEKSSLSVNRTAASKSNSCAKDAKRLGSAHSESSRAEKDAVKLLTVLEAEHDANLDFFHTKMSEFETWRDERELELEAKIKAFVFALWDGELESIQSNIHDPLKQLELAEALEEELVRKKFIVDCRTNPLVKVYEQLVAKGGTIALAVAAWKSRLNENLVLQDEIVKANPTHEPWELRRQEVKIFAQERPDERYRLELRKIWQLPIEYQAEALENEPIPLRKQKNVLERENIETSSNAVTKASVENVSGETMTSIRQSLSGLATDRGRKQKSQTRTKAEIVNSLVMASVRNCLADAAVGSASKNVLHAEPSDDEWENEDEKVANEWMFEPASPETVTRLLADFKFVSFKELANGGTLGPILEKPTHRRERRDRDINSEEASSESSEENFEM